MQGLNSLFSNLHFLLLHGIHLRFEVSAKCFSPQGPVLFIGIAPNKPMHTGCPDAEAMCSGPVSPEIKKSHCARRAAVSLKFSLPATMWTFLLQFLNMSSF